jgi:hypothetical protein
VVDNLMHKLLTFIIAEFWCCADDFMGNDPNLGAFQLATFETLVHGDHPEGELGIGDQAR